MGIEYTYGDVYQQYGSFTLRRIQFHISVTLMYLTVTCKTHVALPVPQQSRTHPSQPAASSAATCLRRR